MVFDTTVDNAPRKEGNTTTLNEQDLEQEYSQNLANGKKNLLCGNFPEAVACFQSACCVQSDKYGDTAHECAEAFFYYGRALLELARIENGILGSALKKVPEMEESDSDDEESKPQPLAGIPRMLREATDRFISTGHFTKPAPQTSRDLFGECSSNGEPSSSKNSPGNNGSAAEQPSEDPEDIQNMQLAWEMLELAKVLHAKKPESDENNLIIAQCDLKLGELGLEIENYTQAINDFLQCLTIQNKLLPENDRRLAETHYNLGLAYSFDKKYDDSMKHFKSALSVLESRIEYLNNSVDDKVGDNTEITEDCDEVVEIKTLIPDINSKIEDVEAMKKQEMNFRSRSLSQAAQASTTFLPSSSGISQVCSVIPTRKAASGQSSSTKESSQPDNVNDISHLIRRKRVTVNERSSGDVETSNKKLKEDSSTEVVPGNGAIPSDNVVNDENSIMENSNNLESGNRRSSCN